MHPGDLRTHAEALLRFPREGLLNLFSLMETATPRMSGDRSDPFSPRALQDGPYQEQPFRQKRLFTGKLTFVPMKAKIY